MKLVKNLVLVLALGLAGIAPVLAEEEAPMQISGAKTVNADQVIDLATNQSKLVIIDARHPGDYNAGAIEGAINILDTDLTAEKMAQVVPTKSTPVLIYCNGLKCGRAANAVEKALSWGYSDIYYYALGMQDWKAKGLPVVTRH